MAQSTVSLDRPAARRRTYTSFGLALTALAFALVLAAGAPAFTSAGLTSPGPTGGGWITQNSGTIVQLNAVSRGTAVGAGGTILHVKSGTWSAVSSGTTTDLYSIAVSEWGSGFAVGGGTPTSAKAAGIILATKDDGATWSPQTIVFNREFGPVWYRLTGVALFQDSPMQVGYLQDPLGWAVGVYDEEPGAAVTSTDFFKIQNNSYADWTYVKGTRGLHFSAIDFPDAYHGWIVGDRGGRESVIYATTDGGDNWFLQRPGSGDIYLTDVTFADAAHGWAVGTGGTILATTTGGAFWDTQHSGTGADLHAVSFSDDSHGWAVGDHGTILATKDGGKTWVAQSSGSSASLRGVDFTSASSGIVVGSGGTILATTTGGFPPPAPAIAAIKPSSAKRGALVTISGTAFGASQGTGSVQYGSKTCTSYDSWSDSLIKCRVPTTASTGKVKVTVTTSSGASNAVSFKVKK
jgi:photosystem II stability/assembly factor-like uncharacterized protein